MQNLITGIQQCGIGTPNAHEAALYYKSLFGLDAFVFDDTAEAVLMKAYTGNEVQKRRAILTMNMQGGDGFELWQFISRQPEAGCHPVRMGDLGLFAIKMKCPNVVAAYHHFSQVDHCSVSALQKTPHDHFHFWLTDKYGQVFNMVQATGLFKNNGNICGGVCGAVIGVSHLETSLLFYKNLLGLDVEAYNTTATNLGPVTYAAEKFHSVSLQKAAAANGAFSQLLGDIQIELIESKDYTGKRIFHNRY